jgi:hypothetical protein
MKPCCTWLMSCLGHVLPHSGKILLHFASKVLGDLEKLSGRCDESVHVAAHRSEFALHLSVVLHQYRYGLRQIEQLVGE